MTNMKFQNNYLQHANFTQTLVQHWETVYRVPAQLHPFTSLSPSSAAYPLVIYLLTKVTQYL